MEESKESSENLQDILVNSSRPSRNHDDGETMASIESSETSLISPFPEQLTEIEESVERALEKALSLILTLQNLGLDVSNDIPIAELPKLFTLPEDAIPYMELADKFGKNALSFGELGWILSETVNVEDI